MQLGVGKAVITPPLGTPMAGFGHRDHGAESVRDDVEVRALWLQEDAEESALCLVAADIIGFDEALMGRVRAEIQARYGLPPERLVLAASHTHSAGATCEKMVGVGQTVPEVVTMVLQRVLEAVAEAQSVLHPVTLRAGRGLCAGYAVNRRLILEDGVHFVPNPDGPRDDTVTVLAYHDADDDAIIRAVLFHFTCHPTVMGDYAVTGDYPGVARRHIESELGNGAVAAFLPGCFGNIRADTAYLGGQSFRPGLPQDLAAFGSALGREVVRVARGQTQPVTPRLDGKSRTITLPLKSHPDRETLEQLAANGTPLEKAWSAGLLAAPFATTRPFNLHRFDLADKVTLLTMGGETSCEYGLAIRQKRPDAFLIPMGYTNGLIGYICLARQIAEGGYEADRSSIYYGLPSPFAPEIEPLIYAAIDDLLA